ncbi:LysR substrate-binding domain-containing protein [Phenylobacterium deserti]|uniref:LysR family transcriptional regulator n=1 Tax=Phenylobacterium deserti TaxID=1914756 RepID=A0A328ACG7_9CAUL|nr:LysR substrate-binding domain-containing protein [Phenylobacterium deserti]RAK52329.1 LysR family transcriptional regulator [Phenylobacterium deserti]
MSGLLSAIPLSAIRVFEAAARLGSFTRAAQELGMTQAAVSWQVKALEKRLDQHLFRRLPREVALTPAGERLARAASEAMSVLRTALEDLSTSTGGVLAVTSVATLATQWLAPRLGAFQLKHPDIAVRLDTAVKTLDLVRGEADVALRLGSGEWDGLESIRLFPSILTPLCTPEVAAQLSGAPAPEVLLEATRIGEAVEWNAWFKAAGVPPPETEARLVMQADFQALEVAAALADGGVALGSPILFARELAAGRLVQPFETCVTFRGGYWLAYPKERRRTRKIAEFRDWLVACVAEDPAIARYAPLAETAV